MSHRLKSLAPDWRTLLSGVLIVLAFPPWNIWPLIWIALIPWFEALARAPSRRAAFREGVWLSFFMSMGGFYWVAAVLKEFGDLPWSLAIIGLLLFSLVGQPQFLILGPVIKSFEQKGRSPRDRSGWAAARMAGLVAVLYTGIDWILPKLFVDTFGHAFYASRIFRQCADLGGATLLTLLAFLVNDALWVLGSRVRRRTEPSARPAIRASLPQAACVGALCLAAAVYGFFRERQIHQRMNVPHPSLQLGVIQANIGDFDKIAAERGIRGAAEKVLETFFSMSDKALTLQPRPHALVWPETSYPSTFRTPNAAEELARDQALENYTRDRKVPVLFGGYDHAAGKDFNAFFFLNPIGSPGYHGGEADLQIYRKNMLLLFGEYIPLSEHIKFLRDAFPQVGNFGRGVGPEVLEVQTGIPGIGTVPVNPIICYEALFPNYILAAVRKGSQVILNITNDSWFGAYGEPQLHLALTTFRSIESRRPQVRSTNTGISALIMPDGEITHATTINKPEIMNVSVPLLPPIPTLMLAWGDWFGTFCLLLSALGCLGIWIAGRRRRADA